MTSATLGILRTDLAYPVPWALRDTHVPGVHRLTNLGRHPLARVSITVLHGGVPAPGVVPGTPVTLAPGESLEVRANSALRASPRDSARESPHDSPRDSSAPSPPGSTVVVSWQRHDGTHYLWSAPITP